MEQTFDAVVVGAGIAGLTCALALGRRGVRTVVLERDSSFTSRLQGFHYHFNESESLDKCLAELGLLDEVKAIRIRNDGHVISLANHRGRWIACWDGRNRRAIGDIGRGELRDLLLARCSLQSNVEFRMGCRVAQVHDGAPRRPPRRRWGASARRTALRLHVRRPFKRRAISVRRRHRC